MKKIVVLSLFLFLCADIFAQQTSLDYVNGLKGLQVSKGSIFCLAKVKFAPASSELQKESQAELDDLGNYLLKNKKVAIEIGSHVDTLNAQNSLNLTNNRVKIVKEYLENKGVESSRLEAVGYGRTRPLSDKKGDRMEITILK